MVRYVLAGLLGVTIALFGFFTQTLWLMNADGSGQIRLWYDGDSSGPSWIP